MTATGAPPRRAAGVETNGKAPDTPVAPAAGITSLVPVLLLGFYVLVWYLEFNKRVPLFAAIRLEFLVGGALILVSLAQPDPEKDRRPKSGVVPFLATFFAMLVLSFAFTQNFDVSWNVFIDRAVKFACFSFFIASIATTPKKLAIFFIAYYIAFLKLGSESLIGTITGSMIWENQGIPRLNGMQGSMYGHPNSLSGSAVGMLPFIYYFIRLVPWPWKSIIVLETVFVVNIIVFTGSRTGYIGVLAFLAVIFLRSKFKGRFIVAALLIGLIVVPLIPSAYVERFQSIYTGQEKEGASKETRLEIVRDATQVFAAYPMGVGIGAFPTVRWLMFGRYQDTHNLYLEVLTNIGIQGFLAWAAFVLAILALFSRTRRRVLGLLAQLADPVFVEGRGLAPEDVARHRRALSFVEAVISATSLFVMLRLVLGLFGMDLYEIYWWFALGLAIATHKIAWHYTEIIAPPAPAQTTRNRARAVGGASKVAGQPT